MAISSADWVQLTDFPDSATQPALSSDGHMLAFIRGPETFITDGQVYLKFLPDGQPIQLTHDDRPKLSPIFSPDGSRIAYPGLENFNWNTYQIPVTRVCKQAEELLAPWRATTLARRRLT